MTMRILLGALILLPASGLDAQQNVSAADSNALRRLQTEWHRAYVAGDSARLNVLLAPDAQVVRSSGVVLDRAHALTHYRGRDTTGLALSTAEQVALLSDGLALVVSRVTERDQGVVRSLRVADVFEGHRGDWRLRHSQWTLLPGQGEAVAVDSAALAALAGRYGDETGRVVTVEAAGNRIRVRTSAGNVYSLVPRSAVQFFRPGETGEWVFARTGSKVPQYVVINVVQSATLLRRLP